MTLLDELHDALGAGAVLVGDDAAPAATDWRGRRGLDPVAVVRPSDVAGVETCLAIAARHHAPVVAMGGNTGLSGGALVTSPGTVIVRTDRLSAVRDVDPVGFTITAEAGVTIERLQQAAAEVGCSLGLDWGARGSATLGGAVSTDAGGMQVLRWGTTRDRLLGVEVVLADGRRLDLLRALRKNAVGPGLANLFAGSEGTLGIVTAATLRLEPAPADRAAALVALADLPAVLALYAVLRRSLGGDLAAFELLPEIGVAAVVAERDVVRPIATVAPWYALVGVEGEVGVGERLVWAIAGSDDDRILDAVLAEDSRRVDELWTLRDELPPEALLGRKGVKYDLAVPTASIVDLVASIEERLAAGTGDWRDLELYCFGHVGDGNLHLYVLPTDAAPLDDDRRHRLVTEIDEMVWSLGGTISAEHGVGLDLVGRIDGQTSATERDVLSAVKAALDPQGRLNPGKGPFPTAPPDGRH